MPGAVLVGLLSAVIVAAPALIQAGVHRIFPAFSFSLPIFTLGVACVAMMIQRFAIGSHGTRTYDGISDLLIHIHSPANPDTPRRWGLRGLVSFLLGLFGGSAGAEGAAVEWTHGLAMRARARSARWFEQRRRTDAASTLAAGVAAAFGAPFAAVLLPIELGIGGRTVSSVVSALAAFLGFRAIASMAGLATFDLGGTLYGFHFSTWREWFALPLIALGAGVAGTGLVRFIRYSKESLAELFIAQAWMRTLVGGTLLFLVALIYKTGHAPTWSLLEQVLWGRRTGAESGLLLITQILSLALVLSGFGTIGLLWPLFAIGGMLGYGLDQWMLEPLLGSSAGFAAAAGLAGGAALWGAVLGAPLTGALLGYELAHNVYVLIPCFAAGMIGREVRRRLRTRALVDYDLEARGISLADGRSKAVLEAIAVREAMVTDHETVHEHEPVSEIHTRLLNSRYPFMPVVNASGAYVGLLTIDMVEEAWHAQEYSVTSNSPLAKLLEAKDLLYRAGFKVPTVRVGDKLSVTPGLFEDVPCVPVLGDDGRVTGLLFVFSVRLAYDREVARRSLALIEG